MRDHVGDVCVLYSDSSHCRLESRKYPVDTHSFRAKSNTSGITGSRNAFIFRYVVYTNISAVVSGALGSSVTACYIRIVSTSVLADQVDVIFKGLISMLCWGNVPTTHPLRDVL